MRELELDYRILIKALHEMTRGISVDPPILASHIQQETGIFNIERIIQGKNKPFAKTWHKIHKAFPEQVPAPQYTDGRHVFVSKHVDQSISNSAGAVQAGGDIGGNISTNGSDDLPPRIKQICKDLANYANPNLLNKIEAQLEILKSVSKL